MVYSLILLVPIGEMRGLAHVKKNAHEVVGSVVSGARVS
jgi:hypothetical protein